MGKPVRTRVVVALGSPDDLDNLLEDAATALRAGQIVVFPTDTVYGVAALAKDMAAVRPSLRPRAGTEAWRCRSWWPE